MAVAAKVEAPCRAESTAAAEAEAWEEAGEVVMPESNISTAAPRSPRERSSTVAATSASKPIATSSRTAACRACNTGDKGAVPGEEYSEGRGRGGSEAGMAGPVEKLSPQVE